MTGQSKRFSAKTVVVTGAAHGIGQAIAQRFGVEGAQVVVNDVNAAGAASTAQAINAAGGSAVDIFPLSRFPTVEAA